MEEPKVTVRKYVDSKEIKVSELRGYFPKVKEFQVERGDLKCCGNCGNVSNTARLPSESWTSALYCWKCDSITIMFHADRMSGNHTDYYEVYSLK